MAINHIHFSSQILGKGTSVNVFLPQVKRAHYPVLYLLHGWSDDCHAWLDNTSLARYGNEYPFIIVMPQVELSYYTNMFQGEAYFDFLTQELPAFIQQWFPVSPRPEATFVAGLSMGGYGAFKWALSYPNQFRGAAALSGALDVVNLWENDPSRDKRFTRIFGSLAAVKGSENDLQAITAKHQATAQHLCLYQSCGTEDFLLSVNRQYARQWQSQFANYEYQEHPGTHNWAFWDQEIQTVLAKFAHCLENAGQ